MIRRLVATRTYLYQTYLDPYAKTDWMNMDHTRIKSLDWWMSLKSTQSKELALTICQISNSHRDSLPHISGLE